MTARNALYYGDNLDVLRFSIPSESVDLVYLDPPFNSQANYNVLFRSPAGGGSAAQIEAFKDTWHWGEEAERAFDEVMRSGNTNASELLRAFRIFLGENDMMAYIAMMTVRLLELHRVLKRTGSIFLHCDATASHYLKLTMDSNFGLGGYLNEIIWKRTSAHANASRRLGAVHDVIIFYCKDPEKATWNQLYTPYTEAYIAEHFVHRDPDGRLFRRSDLVNPGVRPNLRYDYVASNGRTYKPHSNGWKVSLDVMQELDRQNRLFFPAKDDGRLRKKIYLDEAQGVPLTDVWDDLPPIHASSPERLGYPTQKPVALLERVLGMASNPGDTVLDPFCGCGTTIHAAQKLGRHWIGIDITHLAITLIERRLHSAFPGITFDVHGTPKDMEGARDLARRDKYQFQWWALSLVDAQPYGGKKKGADGGIDGLIYFRSGARTTERAIVSVKGGDSVGVPMVRDLKGVMDREKAPIGVFLTLTPPTAPMVREAAAAGFHEQDGRQYPRVQIITVADALLGAKPAIPLVDTGAAFKRAPREATGTQPLLDI